MGRYEELAALGADELVRESESSDPDYVVVRTGGDLERLCDDITGERDHPIVGLTLRSYSCDPVLRACDIRAVVGRGTRIYLIEDEDLLQDLQDVLGRRLGISSGAIRVWWPGVAKSGDPGDHPLIVGLEDEDYRVTLEEFAHEFDLSRPRVRGRLRTIDDARALLQRELVDLREERHRLLERVRDCQIEAHELRTRAEAAEDALLAAHATRREAAPRSPAEE
jgi:hypothetical protein